MKPMKVMLKVMVKTTRYSKASSECCQVSTSDSQSSTPPVT
jgi:hypothetical protein